MNDNENQLHAAVFDWAGTTVDYGSRAPAMVFQKVFSKRGVEVSIAQAREPMGMAKREHIAAVAAIPEVAESWQAKHGTPCGEADIDAMYEEFLPLQKAILHEHSDLIPGAAEAIAACREMGLAIGSSTGYTRELMEIVSQSAAEQGYAPDFYLCAEDAPRGRPAPFLLFEAAKRFNVYPMWKIVKIDDTTLGIEAGRNAHCWTIGISKTGNLVGLSPQEWQRLDSQQQQQLLHTATDRLTRVGAHYVVDSVAEVPAVIKLINERIARGERPY